LLQIFAVLLLILWLIEKHKNKLAAFDKISVLFLIFIVVRIISVIFSEFPDSSIPLFYKDAIFFLGFFAMSFYLKVFDEKKIKFIVFTFVIAAMVVALIGLIRFNLGIVHRAESFSSGFMAYSMYLLTSLGIGVLLFNFIAKKKYVIAWTAGIGLIISGIIISLGRTNIALAILVFLVSIFFLKINKWFSIVIVALTIMIAVISFQINTQEISSRIEQPVVMSDRDIIWGSAKELFFEFEHPLLGYGPRTFGDIFTDREQLADKGVGSWHNDYIQLYLESGILGLFSYLLLVGYSLFVALKFLIKRKANQFERSILIGLIISTIALLLAAVTSGFINSPIMPVVLAFFLAFISSIVYPVERFNEKLIAEEEK
jgi:O-antigen ligase